MPTNLFRPQLKAALAANATLAGIVGTRILPINVPRTQGMPSLTYRVRAVRREQDLDGPNGIANARVQYTCRALNEADVDAVREELRNLFDGSSAAIGTIMVLNVYSSDEEDDYTDAADSSDAGTYSQRFTLTYRYREPAPTLS